MNFLTLPCLDLLGYGCQGKLSVQRGSTWKNITLLTIHIRVYVVFQLGSDLVPLCEATTWIITRERVYIVHEPHYICGGAL